MTPTEIGSAFATIESGDPASVADGLASLGADASTAAFIVRGLARYDAGQFAAAADDFGSVLAREPQNPVAAAHLALAAFRLGDAKEAARLLDSYPLFPQYGFLARFLELFWPLRGKTGIARAVYGEEHDTPYSAEFARFEAHEDRVTPRLRAKLAHRMMSKAGDEFFHDHYASARTLYQRATRLVPDSQEARTGWAMFLFHDGDGEEALRTLEPMFAEMRDAVAKDASKVADVAPEALAALAAPLHAIGRHEDALRLLSFAHPAGPDDWGAHFLGAMCWQALGRRAESREALRIALGPYFIDTWEHQVRPFILKTRAWLKSDEAEAYAKSQAAGTSDPDA